MTTNTIFLASRILVGIAGYGDSPEFAEVVTNDECNVYAQWSRASNLLPGESKILVDGLYEKAKEKGIHVMTIYGTHDGPTTKRLREAWGDLYLGNNIGEYAGFLYQDEKSYAPSWPKCRDLKEAHDWLVGEMLSGPGRAQLARPPEEREPHVFSTSGSPLACYELEAGMDVVCNEMFAVGCGDLAYAASEARGAARRHGRPGWMAWLAHEWQTCWLKLPYGVPQKQDSLEVGLKELWLMGAKMLVLESGSGGTQAQDYTPPDGDCPPDTKTPKQGYDGEIPRAYRRTMKNFYQWTQATPRAEGEPVVDAALLLGNYDGYVGMTYPIFAIFGQHHLAETNANWKCGAPEFTWEAVMEEFFPHPADAVAPFVNGWIGGSPFGQIDVVNVDDDLDAGKLSRYKVVAFGGWNTMTPKIAATLREHAAAGGTVALMVPQLSSRIDRDFAGYSAEDLVQAVPGVVVKGPVEAGGGFPGRVAEAELAPGVEVVESLDDRPLVVKAPCGKGAFYLYLAWDFPAQIRSCADTPYPENKSLDLWRKLLAGLVGSLKRPVDVRGDGTSYVNWAVYPDGTAYFLNTDCVKERTVEINGVPTVFAPKEMKIRKF